MLTDHGAELLVALRRTLRRWECETDGTHVTFRQRNHGLHVSPRLAPSWQQLLDGLSGACADHGIAQGYPLPLRGLGDADLTFSAVQALDPYLKRRQLHTYGVGYIPQPVVRFTGDRNDDGDLLPGFATSFVNVSLVQPVPSVDEHAALIDIWLSVLSRIGFHTQHLTISGSLAIWHRPPVAGVTLHIRHQQLALGDAVLLMNADDPTFLATDIGSGLERLRWALTGRSWENTVYGHLADAATNATLDAIRTATLIVGSGITPASRGAGSSVRRLLRPQTTGPGSPGSLGFSRAVRWAHEYWSMVRPLAVPWPEVCRILDDETRSCGD